MPICIECRYPVPQLYHVSHSNGPKAPAGTNEAIPKRPKASSTTRLSDLSKGAPSGGEASRKGTGGRDVRLTQCPRCKRFADKYVEHDYVVLFIDLMLVKPQVYRHLLFNRLARTDDEYDPSITRLGILLLLFEVYITWSHIETLPSTQTSPSPIPALPILLQYAFYLLYCVLTTVAQHLAIRALTKVLVPLGREVCGTNSGEKRNGGGPRASTLDPTSVSQGSGEDPTSQQPLPPARSSDIEKIARPTAISSALFVSSCMKLFPILMVVWRYADVEGQVGRGVEWAVAVQNLEALSILLGCSYVVAGLLISGGWVAKIMIGRVLMGAVGLGRAVEG